MLVVETIAKIRRAYFVHGQPIKAICHDLGVSRKVVRKVIRSEATEFRYEREAQPFPKIGPWSDKLDQLLVANEGKASRMQCMQYPEEPTSSRSIISSSTQCTVESTQLLLCDLIFVFGGQFVEIGLVAVLLVCRPRYRDGNAVVFNLSRLISGSK